MQKTLKLDGRKREKYEINVHATISVMRDRQTNAGGIKSSSAVEQNILPGSNLRVGKL